MLWDFIPLHCQIEDCQEDDYIIPLLLPWIL
jgi:hypothetical protein